MPRNDGSSFERLIFHLQQALAKLGEQIAEEPVKLQQNVRISGRSTCKHQVDIFYSFKRMGLTYSVGIECKDHGRPVAIGRVRDFFSVMHDTQITGLMASTSPCQSGAKQFADFYNVKVLIFDEKQGFDILKFLR